VGRKTVGEKKEKTAPDGKEGGTFKSMKGQPGELENPYFGENSLRKRPEKRGRPKPKVYFGGRRRGRPSEQGNRLIKRLMVKRQNGMNNFRGGKITLQQENGGPKLGRNPKTLFQKRGKGDDLQSSLGTSKKKRVSSTGQRKKVTFMTGYRGSYGGLLLLCQFIHRNPLLRGKQKKPGPSKRKPLWRPQERKSMSSCLGVRHRLVQIEVKHSKKY